VVGQGFGTVGSWGGRDLDALGALVVAVSDVGGAMLNDNGLDVPRLVETVEAGGRVTDADVSYVKLSQEELLTLECDILIPAALGDAITTANAGNVRATLILEGANHPVTPQADAELADRGITVIPDILANGGGVTGSYFEWTQNIQQFTWTEARFNAELRERLDRVFHEVASYVEERECTYRLAAYAIALERVVRAIQLRGYV
jgi:glutamate dehydrogenase (NAD(P)+)